MVASGAGMNTVVNPASIPRPPGMFNHGILSKPGRVLAIAGQCGLLPGVDGPQDFASQTRVVWDNIKAIVEAAGGGMADIVSINIYLKDASHWALLDSIRKDYLVEPYPASTAIAGVQFVLPAMEIEISAIAVIAA